MKCALQTIPKMAVRAEELSAVVEAMPVIMSEPSRVQIRILARRYCTGKTKMALNIWKS